MGSLNIGVALWSLGKSETFEQFEQLLDAAVATGVKAVQPWCVDVPKWKATVALDPDRCVTPEQRAAVRRACETRGLAISGFCAQLAGPSSLGGFGEDDADVQNRVDKTIRALQLAADIGAPIVTTHIGAVPEDHASPVYARFVKHIGAIAQAGKSSGGILAIETGQESAESLKRFIEDLGSDHVRVNYDPANMRNRGPVEGVATLAPYIVHTHAKDHDPKSGKPTVGMGVVPWDDYIAALKKIGYDGWYAVEDESGDADVVESVTAGRRFLEKY